MFALFKLQCDLALMWLEMVFFFKRCDTAEMGRDAQTGILEEFVMNLEFEMRCMNGDSYGG